MIKIEKMPTLKTNSDRKRFSQTASLLKPPRGYTKDENDFEVVSHCWATSSPSAPRNACRALIPVSRVTHNSRVTNEGKKTKGNGLIRIFFVRLLEHCRYQKTSGEVAVVAALDLLGSLEIAGRELAVTLQISRCIQRYLVFQSTTILGTRLSGLPVHLNRRNSK